MDAVAPSLSVEEKRQLAGQFREQLTAVREGLAPVAGSETRLLPVPAPLRGLFPEGGLRRSSAVEVSGVAATSLTFALVSSATAEGTWVAFAGSGDLGLLAARELGVDLRRCLLVDPPPGSRVAEALSLLVDTVDVIVLATTFGLPPAVLRRLRARARERGVVLIHRRPDRDVPLETVDLRLVGETEEWVGLASGAGRLAARRLSVSAHGRGRAARGRTAEVWLPDPEGAIASVELALPRPSSSGLRVVGA